MELFNIQELTRLAAAAPHDEGHAGLLTALRERYPGVEFLLTGAGGEWNSRNYCLVDSAGNKIADDFSLWARAEYDAAGQDIRALWEKYRDAGLVLGVVCGTTLYIAAPYSSDPDAFFQIEIELGHEVTTLHAFPSIFWGPPEDLKDLCSPLMLHGVENALELSPWRYNFRRLTNVRQFLKEMTDVERRNRLAELPEMERKVIRTTILTESGQTGHGAFDVSDQVTETPFLEMFPDWLDRLPPGVRFFRDWKESSASAWRLCDHWRLELQDYTDKDGKRHMSIIPQWAVTSPGRDLPEISPDCEASPYGVMESLIQFDELLGVTFGWYFYALHGNRITGSAISVVARGVKEGKIRLPERDEKIVLKWDESSYGF